MTSDVDTFTDLPEHSTNSDLRNSRRVFYANVLGLEQCNLTEDLRQLCEQWRNLCRAKWVWLWVYHDDIGGDMGHWELSAVACDGQIENYVLDNLSPSNGDQTVAELCASTGLPFFVADIATWNRTADGRLHRVVCASELMKMGCSSVLCVPIIAPSAGSANVVSSASQFSAPLRAAMCIHFDKPPPVSEREGRSSLLLMGKLTARMILTAFEAEQHRIISKMNMLAVEYLTRQNRRRPSESRRDYLKLVITLINEHLRIQFTSFFYRSENRRFVYCVATNSLFDEGGRPLMKHERLYRNATYRRGEGLTGQVFKTGKPFFSRMGHTPDRPTYKFRETPLETPEGELAWVIYPICAPPIDSKIGRKPEVLGVVRCIGNQAAFVKGKMRNIDPLQLRTLDFIVRMLAPVLETMEANIEREKVISIIKHDLFAPLEMAKALLHRASKDIAESKFPDEHFLGDMAFCLHTSVSLATSLDQAPTEVRECVQTETKMEADLVQGIKKMMSGYAFKYSGMTIFTGDIKGIFPECIMIDRDLISRALTNLIVNAVKYGEPKSVISILARSDDAGYYLLVHNKGPKIPELERDLIFKEGYRSEAVVAKIGMGMGLPIAKAIMRKHGGDLKLLDSADGTTFGLFFPWHLQRIKKE